MSFHFMRILIFLQYSAKCAWNFTIQCLLIDTIMLLGYMTQYPLTLIISIAIFAIMQIDIFPIISEYTPVDENFQNCFSLFKNAMKILGTCSIGIAWYPRELYRLHKWDIFAARVVGMIESLPIALRRVFSQNPFVSFQYFVEEIGEFPDDETVLQYCSSYYAQNQSMRRIVAIAYCPKPHPLFIIFAMFLNVGIIGHLGIAQHYTIGLRVLIYLTLQESFIFMLIHRQSAEQTLIFLREYGNQKASECKRLKLKEFFKYQGIPSSAFSDESVNLNTTDSNLREYFRGFSEINQKRFVKKNLYASLMADNLIKENITQTDFNVDDIPLRKIPQIQCEVQKAVSRKVKKQVERERQRYEEGFSKSLREEIKNDYDDISGKLNLLQRSVSSQEGGFLSSFLK